MAGRRRISVFVDEEHAKGLKTLKERDGIPEAEAIRRAITEFLERKAVVVKADRPRVGARKRP